MENETESTIWKVARITGKRRTASGLEYLVQWEGWGPEDDSWEPAEHILDESLIADFRSSREVVVNSDLALFQLRDRVARLLMASGAPYYGKEVEVPLAAQPEVARALLKRLAQPRDGEPLKVVKEENSGSQDLVLDVRYQAHISEIVGLQSARPDVGRGALRFNAGRAVNQDMVCVHGPLILKASGPKPRRDGSFKMGVYSFKLNVCAVKFNGKTGEPKFEKMGDASYMKANARREEVVADVKRVLRNARSPLSGQAFDHWLCRQWAHLPAGQWCLADEDAMPAQKDSRKRQKKSV